MDQRFPPVVTIRGVEFRRASAVISFDLEKTHHALVLVWKLDGGTITLNDSNFYFNEPSPWYSVNLHNVTYIKGWAFEGKFHGLFLSLAVQNFFLVSTPSGRDLLRLCY